MDLPRRPQSLFALIVVLVAWPVAFARGEGPGWDPRSAASYLDERAKAWFAFDGRGTGATRSTCISCHTLLPYALARPVLGGLSGTVSPPEPRAKLLAETGMRVEHWGELDSKTYGLYYLLARQRDDGGWSLPSLGAWARSDGTPQSTASDGYATGLVLHVVQTAGVDKSHARVARGLAWLKTHQSPSGAWPCASVFKKRDPGSHTGKFMSDAATAFAVLAPNH